MPVVDSVDFNNVAADIGESVTVNNPSETVSSDYGSLTASTDSNTTETAIIQPFNSNKIARSDGRLKEGDCFGMFRSDSVVQEGSMITVGSVVYIVKNLTNVNPSGSTHHFEADLILSR